MIAPAVPVPVLGPDIPDVSNDNCGVSRDISIRRSKDFSFPYTILLTMKFFFQTGNQYGKEKKKKENKQKKQSKTTKNTKEKQASKNIPKEYSVEIKV